ncbi:MAG: quinoprotein dehydrogenase-associated putative ABC transporter substrate-binding protein [Acidobacteriota bacterium]
MCSAFKIAAICALAGSMAMYASAAKLRVCSDPNNLPYSNAQKQGFENQIAKLIASDLGMQVDYFWFPQRSKFFEKTLQRGVCDVVMGVPVGLEGAATTAPYYRSSYVFISQSARHLGIKSFDDPRLRKLKIGVQVLGEQDDTLPPVHSLVARGLVHNMVGYSIFGNLNERDPAADVVRAVEKGEVDIAVVWGPLGGYFSRHSSVPLTITPTNDDRLYPSLPFHYDIAIGVRPGDTALKQALNRELTRRHADIEQILRAYGVPQMELPVETARATEE